jgi:DNA-binding NarL/FixJ family response regulator
MLTFMTISHDGALESTTPRDRGTRPPRRARGAAHPPPERQIPGQRIPAIAADLFVSQSTVRNHLSSIYAKLGMHSQVDLIRLVRRGTKRPAADR